MAPAFPVPLEMASATLPVNPVAVLPAPSCAVTTTPKPVPAVVLDGGWVVNTSWLAVPAVMLNVPLVAGRGARG